MNQTILGPSDLVPLKLADRKGGDMAEWSPELRVRQFPEIDRREWGKSL